MNRVKQCKICNAKLQVLMICVCPKCGKKGKPSSTFEGAISNWNEVNK